MAEVRRLFVDGKFGQIHLRMAVPKEVQTRPLVCLHMFPQSGRNFEEFLKYAGNDRVVIAPDFPGYGESSPPQSPITAHEYAEAIWEAIDDLGLVEGEEKIDLFGVHAGSKLSTELAFQRPEDINRIVLSSAAVFEPEELKSYEAAFSPVPLDEEGTRFKYLWSMLVRNRAADVSYELCSVGLAEMLRGGEGYEWGHEAVFKYNKVFSDRLSTLKHPIALLNPNDDLFDITPRALKYMQNGELFNRSHWSFGFLEVNAKEAAELVTKWLAGPVPSKESDADTYRSATLDK